MADKHANNFFKQCANTNVKIFMEKREYELYDAFTNTREAKNIRISEGMKSIERYKFIREQLH